MINCDAEQGPRVRKVVGLQPTIHKTNIGAQIIRKGLWGHYTLTIIRSPQNTDKYLRPYFAFHYQSLVLGRVSILMCSFCENLQQKAVLFKVAPTRKNKQKLPRDNIDPKPCYAKHRRLASQSKPEILRSMV